jgi:glycosyltransferase involved in cell wall biosynthesis
LVVRPDTAEPPRDPLAFYGIDPVPTLRVERVPVSGSPVARRAQYLAGALARAARSSRDTILFTRDLGLASLLLRLPWPLSRPLVYESHGYAPTVVRARPEMLSGAAAASDGKLRRLAAREKQVWVGASGYVSITQTLADELEQRFGPRRASAVVHDGVRLAADATWCGRPLQSPAVVGYAGHLYPWKGVDLVVDALTHLEGVQGLIVGGHPKEPDLGRVRKRVDALGLSSRVIFTGHVPPAEVPALLQRADVLVLPNPPGEVSMRYTSPLKLFEYLASGRPVVASDLPAFREVLDDSRNAVLFEAGSAFALRSAIARLLAEPALAERIGREGFETARQFSWDRRAERLEQLFAAL